MATAPIVDAEVWSAWQAALQHHEADFTPEDLVEIKKGSKPEDLLQFIKTLEVEHDKSRLSKLLRSIGGLGQYFTTYQRALDIISQGLPSPGCLVWGCIRLVLSVSNPITVSSEHCSLAWQGMVVQFCRSGR